jgi:hypothetical protein
MLKTILLSSSCCNNAENKWSNCHDNGWCWSSPSSNGDDGDAAAVATEHLSLFTQSSSSSSGGDGGGGCFYNDAVAKEEKTKRKKRGEKKKSLSLSLSENVLIPKLVPWWWVPGHRGRFSARSCAYGHTRGTAGLQPHLTMRKFPLRNLICVFQGNCELH